jgi:hypothetical protein
MHGIFWHLKHATKHAPSTVDTGGISLARGRTIVLVPRCRTSVTKRTLARGECRSERGSDPSSVSNR